MLKKIAITFLISIFVAASVAAAKPLTLYEIQEGTVQVHCGKLSQGSGTCIAEDSENYYILTNAHVILNEVSKRLRTSNMTINSFNAGYKSAEIPATYVKHIFVDRTVQDMAFLKVSKKYFTQYPLRVIPIAPDGYVVQPKQLIYSAGCPREQSAMSWVGHVVKNDNWIEFKPFPQPGQSGSSIIGVIKGNDGELYSRVIGIVTWTSDNPNGVGGAVPIQAYYDVFLNKVNHSYLQAKIPVNFTHAQYDIRPFNGQLRDLVLPQGGQRLPQPFNPDGRPIIPGQPFNPGNEQVNPNNPYGEPLPDISGIWPGDNSTPQTQPQQSHPQTQPDTNVEIEKEKVPVADLPGKRSWFTYLRETGFGWLQALGLAGVIGIFATLWKFRLRKKVVAGLDVAEDKLEDWVAAKIGKEFASEFREGLEAIELMLLGVADQLVSSQKQATSSVVQEQINKMRELLGKKEVPTEVDVQNLLSAIKRAAADPAEPAVSDEVAKKMEELVALSAKNK